MAKITLKGIVKHVTTVESYGTGSTQGTRQSLILFVPGYVDGWGDKKGQDEEWQLDVFNDKIQRLGLNSNLVDKRVEAVVYVTSKRYKRRDNGADMWMIGATLNEVKLHETNQTVNLTSSTNAGNNW